MTSLRLRGILALSATLPLVWMVGCAKDSSSERPIRSIALSPTAVELYTGQTHALRVTAHYEDGSSALLTSGVRYWAAADQVASVSADGTVTGTGAGTSTVSASVGDKHADAVVTVTAKYPGTVFADTLASGLSYVTFGPNNGPVVDSVERYRGTASLRIDVPASDPWWTGGMLNADMPYSFAAYNAVTFWAKASRTATLNAVGLGMDATQMETALPLTTSWAKYVLPIPMPARLTSNRTVFYFADDAGGEGAAYSIWLDDIQYETLPAATVGAPTAATLGWMPVGMAVGESQLLPTGTAGNTVTFATPALTLTKVGLGYFSLASSDTAVATVNAKGEVTAVANGTTQITATLGTLAVPGSAQVKVAPLAPVAAPAKPTVPAANVMSIHSNGVYTDAIQVSNWHPHWGDHTVFADVLIGGDVMKKYSNLNWAGVDLARAYDVSTMTHFHVDVWTPNMATTFSIKLIDFGADGAYGGGDDFECVFTPDLTGRLSEWVSLDIPIASFTNSNRPMRHLSQLCWVDANGNGLVFIDNIYFRK